MADVYTEPLRHHYTQWGEADAWHLADSDLLEDRVAAAIERWHVQHDVACPSDFEFVMAKWLIPCGTTLGLDYVRQQADRLCVQMPRGNRYILSIEREGGGGDDGRDECVYVHVQNARLATRKQ